MATSNAVQAAKEKYEKAVEEEIERVREAARKEVLEDYDGTLHEECFNEHSIENARDEGAEAGQALAKEAWDYLEVFGGHTAACLSGALAATQALHPLCTCGWNHVATELEKA